MVLKDAYCAGFIDGEGSIDIRHRMTKVNGKSYERFELRLSANQIDLAPLELLREIYGGSFAHRKTSNVVTWVITDVRAAKAITAMRPYLLVKADEADIALRFATTFRGYSNTPGSKGMDRLSDEAREVRAECQRLIRLIRKEKGLKGHSQAKLACEVRDDDSASGCSSARAVPSVLG